MKILHTADWHLGNTFHGHTRFDEHQHFLSWLLQTLKEQQPDAMIVAGDVFDSANPSAAAEELLYDFLLRATLEVPGLQIVITAGNHDSAGRLEAPAALLKTHNIYVRGTIHYTSKGEPDFDYYLLPLAERQNGQASCVCMALPYLRGGDYPAGMTPEQGLHFFFTQLHQHLRKSEYKGMPVVVAAHFYATGADICKDDHSERLVVGGQDCVDANVMGNNVSYAALGHIHKAQQVHGGCYAFYAGSALPMSFSEIAYRHGVQMVEVDAQGEVNVQFIEYSPLRTLVTIPAQGRAVSANDVFDYIAQLPKRGKKDDGRTWPYLEIHVEESQPQPTLMHDVMEALQDRAVHFCRMQRVRPEGKLSDAKASDDATPTADALSAITPLELARRNFEVRYNAPMPDELVKRFTQAQQMAEKESEEQ